MKKTFVWTLVSCLMALSILIMSCGQAEEEEETKGPGITVKTEEKEQEEATEEEKEQVTETEEAVSSDVPKYGGTLRLAANQDITAFDDVVTILFAPGQTERLTNETMWHGDWSRGPAGGYGTAESDWLGWYDIFDHKSGQTAESWDWTLDAENDQGTLVYQVRPGVRFALDPDSEASVLVGGRERTADDVVFSLTQVTTDERAYLWRGYSELRHADIQKTGPWEVTIKVPLKAMIVAVAKFGAYVSIVPQEVVEKYGDMALWQNAVGTGPFILKDYVGSSLAHLERNPTYWDTDPVGPGKGNQLPYIDAFQYLIIPDASTRMAALRTGKVDRMAAVNYEDAATIRSAAPDIVEGEGALGGEPWWIYMNSQIEPFNNVKVRRALSMATDLVTIRDTLNHGRGQILTWPVEYIPAYKDIYLGLDDPEMPESVKELYTYNPDKAKELLAEAGYPDGFRTNALITQVEADYFSIIKDMWSKVGVELDLNVVEIGARTAQYRQGDYEVVGMAGGRGPLSVFYHMVTMVGNGPAGGSGSNIDDPIIDAASEKMQLTYLTDPEGAMATFKDSMKYVLDQAYVISRPMYPTSNFWWPWVKNYSGEVSVGYIRWDNWVTWVWIDEDLKQSMGY